MQTDGMLHLLGGLFKLYGIYSAKKAVFLKDGFSLWSFNFPTIPLTLRGKPSSVPTPADDL